MFGTLGGPELFLIFVVALIIFGPRKLPDIGKSLGKMMAEFRRASNDFRNTIETEVETEKIRDSMRIEPPRVDTVKKEKATPTGSDSAGGTEDLEASAETGDRAEDVSAPSASRESETKRDDADGAPEPSSVAGAPEPPSADGAPEPSSAGETTPKADSAEPVPSTVSREPSPPSPESK